MKQHESPVEREHNVRTLARRITGLCSAFYETATDEQKEQLWILLDDFENTLSAYRKYDQVWDGKLIDIVVDIQGIKVKSKGFSTFDSVMDKARNVFEFIN